MNVADIDSIGDLMARRLIQDGLDPSSTAVKSMQNMEQRAREESDDHLYGPVSAVAAARNFNQVV